MHRSTTRPDTPGHVPFGLCSPARCIVRPACVFDPACAAGTFLNVTAGSVCLTCPANTLSLTGRDALAGCICNIGCKGVAGSACSECTVGPCKGVNGLGTCLDCEARRHLNATAGSMRVTCPGGTDSLVGSDAIAECICS
eukprot:3897226-Rhodomonas_salina.1